MIGARAKNILVGRVNDTAADVRGVVAVVVAHAETAAILAAKGANLVVLPTRMVSGGKLGEIRIKDALQKDTILILTEDAEALVEGGAVQVGVRDLMFYAMNQNGGNAKNAEVKGVVFGLGLEVATHGKEIAAAMFLSGDGTWILFRIAEGGVEESYLGDEVSYLVIHPKGGVENKLLEYMECRGESAIVGVVEVLWLVVETLASVGTILTPERLRGDEGIKLALNEAE